MGVQFPLFVNLQGKEVVVIGGGTVGRRRAQKLIAFGAQVTVVDPKATPIEGATMVHRQYAPEDVQTAFLVVAATDDKGVNHQIAIQAKAVGALVNVADDPGLCDVFFPAICQSETMVAGVVGDGTDHHKTAAVAKKIRDLLNKEDGAWT